MASVSIEFDKRALKNLFGDELKKQLRFATAQTLTQVAFDARKATQKMVRRRSNIKRTFLPNSIVVVEAIKFKQDAIVGLLDRARLEKLLEEGRKREPFSSELIAIPIGAKTKSGRVTKVRKPPNKSVKKRTFVNYWEVLAHRSSYASL